LTSLSLLMSLQVSAMDCSKLTQKSTAQEVAACTTPAACVPNCIPRCQDGQAYCHGVPTNIPNSWTANKNSDQCAATDTTSNIAFMLDPICKYPNIPATDTTPGALSFQTQQLACDSQGNATCLTLLDQCTGNGLPEGRGMNSMQGTLATFCKNLQAAVGSK
jgi:hypothetical protein